MCFLSAGMGLVMAPATESIMGSLPPSKAGVGSAMNDTTRMLGGALGVAVLGSVLATAYRPGVSGRLGRLGVSPSVLASARDSVGGAVNVAATLPPALGREVSAAAKIEFVNAFHIAVFVAALVILFAAAVVFAFLPARALDARQPVEGPLDGIASLTFAEAEGVLEADAEAAELAGSPGSSSGAGRGRRGPPGHANGHPPRGGPGRPASRRGGDPVSAGPLVARPGRPRNQAAGDAILAATLDLLGQRGYGALTVCSVIESAGVSSATLYRRWSTKQDLVMAALASLVPEPTTPDTGTLAGDLDAFVHQMAQSIARRREDIAEALASEVKRNPELAAALRETFLVPRLIQLADILTRAVERGELADGLSAGDALSLVAGPLYHRAFVLGDAVTEDFLRRAVAHAVRGLVGADTRVPAPG